MELQPFEMNRWVERKQVVGTSIMDTSITLQHRIQASPTASSAELDGEVVILDVEHDRYVGLDQVGARVWSLIQEDRTVAELIDQIAREYEASSDQIRQDLLVLLDRLHTEGLIRVGKGAQEKSASEDTTSASIEDRAVMDSEDIETVHRGSVSASNRSRWIRPWADWWMLLWAMVLTVLIRGALSIWSLQTIAQRLRRIARGLPQWAEVTPAYRERAAWAANAVGYRFLPDRPCLTQALVLQYLLLRRGDDSTELRIGVTKSEEGELLAHAWVERNGRVLIGGTASPRKYQQLEGISEKIAGAQ